MKPLVIITRPEADAADAAADIAALGFETVQQPLMHISTLAWQSPDWVGISALIVTSGNAVPALASCAAIKGKPVFVVGARTAEKLRAVGFTNIRGVVERSVELPAVILPAMQADAGTLLHLTSRYRRDDFQAALSAAGYKLDSLFVYKADAVESFHATTLAALRSRHDKLVLFYSPRSVVLFQNLLQHYGLKPALRALCLSAAVADSCGKDLFHAILVAAVPTHRAMLESLAALSV